MRLLDSSPNLKGRVVFSRGEPIHEVDVQIDPQALLIAFRRRYAITDRMWRAEYSVSEYLEALTTNYCARKDEAA